MISLLCALGLAFAGAQPLDVRQFGAVGDGVHDDTAAIQRAADAAYAARGNDTRCLTRQALGGTDAPFAAVVFPSGTYRLSKAVDFQKNIALFGEDGACIVNSNPTSNTFHCRLAHRLIVQGLTFVGGAVQLKHWTKNRDISYLHVSDCIFREATGTSIVSDSYRDEKRECREDASIPYNNSTLILVERCRFESNATALYLYSDGVTVRDCRFVAPPTAEQEQIRAGSGGRLGVEMSFRDSEIFYPGRVIAGTAAIRYDGGRVSFEQVAIRSAEDLVAVRSYSCFNEYGSPSWLKLIDVRLATGDAPVVSCAGDDFPNAVYAYDVINERGGRKKLVAFDIEPTSSAIDDKMLNAKAARGMPAERCLAFMTRGLDAAAFDLSLPPALEKYRQPATPVAWKPPLTPRSGTTFSQELPTGKVFRDESIGRQRRQAPGDDTEKVEALLAAAEAAGGGIVELPARWIRLSRGLRLPDKTLVTCRGRAGVELTDGDGVFFTVGPETSVDSAVERILFAEGGTVLSSAARRGRVRFLDCTFYGQNRPSLHASAGERSEFEIEVSGGQSYTPYLYRGDARTTFDAFWYQAMAERKKGEFRPSHAAIVNEKGGRLALREFLGVPCYFIHTPKKDAYTGDVEPAKNGEIRWIDNHGTLLSHNVRYGGEWGGLTPVWHFGAAKTFITGGVIELFGRLMRPFRAVVVADSPTPDVTICNCRGAGWFTPVEVAWKTAAGDYEAVANARIAGCAPFTCYGPVWPVDPQKADACTFVADFDWAGEHSVQLELEVAHVAKVRLNGAPVAEESFCAPWGVARARVLPLSAQCGRNTLEIEVSNLCTNGVHGADRPAFFCAQVLCGVHALAWSGVGGHFTCGELKPCHRRMRADRVADQ